MDMQIKGVAGAIVISAVGVVMCVGAGQHHAVVSAQPVRVACVSAYHGQPGEDPTVVWCGDPAKAPAYTPDPPPVADDVAQCHALGYEYCSLDEAAVGNARDERYTASLPKPAPLPLKVAQHRRVSSKGATTTTVTTRHTKKGTTTTVTTVSR